MPTMALTADLARSRSTSTSLNPMLMMNREEDYDNDDDDHPVVVEDDDDDDSSNSLSFGLPFVNARSRSPFHPGENSLRSLEGNWRAFHIYGLLDGPMGAHEPSIHPTAYIAPTASLIGDVAIGREASVWFGAVIRGDADSISIGEGSNIQDLSVLHADPGFPLRVGNRCTVGHRVTLHGCTIHDDAIIGMGATILNGVIVGEGSVVGACSVVLEGTVIPPHSLAVGTPAVVRKTYDRDEAVARANDNARQYVARGRLYQRACLRTEHEKRETPKMIEGKNTVDLLLQEEEQQQQQIAAAHDTQRTEQRLKNIEGELQDLARLAAAAEAPVDVFVKKQSARDFTQDDDSHACAKARRALTNEKVVAVTTASNFALLLLLAYKAGMNWFFQ